MLAESDALLQRFSILQAVMTVALLGVMGVFFLLLLGLARRRYMHHLLKDTPTEPVPDIWRESGRRLSEKLGKGLAEEALPSGQDEPPLRRPTFLDDLDKLPPDTPDAPDEPNDTDSPDDRPPGGDKPN